MWTTSNHQHTVVRAEQIWSLFGCDATRPTMYKVYTRIPVCVFYSFLYLNIEHWSRDLRKKKKKKKISWEPLMEEGALFTWMDSKNRLRFTVSHRRRVPPTLKLRSNTRENSNLCKTHLKPRFLRLWWIVVNEALMWRRRSDGGKKQSAQRDSTQLNNRGN